MLISDLCESIDDYDLQGRYDEFNRLYFGGELPRIPVSFRPLKTVGGKVEFAISGQKNDSRLRRMGAPKYKHATLVPGSMKLVISSAYARVPEEIDAILLHEMIHVWEAVIAKAYGENHAKTFLDKRKELIAASGIDIPLTDSTKGLELVNASAKAVGVVLKPISRGRHAFMLMSVPGIQRALKSIQDLNREPVMVYTCDSPLWVQKGQSHPLQRDFAKMGTRLNAAGQVEGYLRYNYNLKWWLADDEAVADLKANGKLLWSSVPAAEGLTEAPIDDVRHVGAWGLPGTQKDRNSSFRDPIDRRLVSHPAHVERMKNMWKKTSTPFNMLFVNNPEGMKYQEVGRVDWQWLCDKMPKTVADPNFKLNDNAVNIIFTNNGGAARVPITPWIMAHRFGHAISRDFYARPGQQFSPKVTNSASLDWKEAFDELEEVINQILACYKAPRFTDERMYDDPARQEKWTVRRKLYQVLGTMKSAREANLRQYWEFDYEIFAQYLITGSIRFNPLPRSFKYGHHTYVWREPEHDLEYYNQALETTAEAMTYRFEDALSRSIGRIYVM